VAEQRGDITLYYLYDDTGSIMGISYGYDTYTFAKNIQGDVIGIYSGGGLVAKYEYNAYGQILSITNASGVDISNNATHIANLNPFRYRGYYYDTETGFYYLQSRYYDPVVGRFLNADAFVSTGQGILGNNMFAYCGNNPVARIDPTGELFKEMFAKAFGFFKRLLSSFFPISDVGCAAPYNEVKGSDDPNDPNCYSFAIGSNVNEQPGYTSGLFPNDYSDVYDVGASVEADLIAKGYTVRKISGPNAKVYANEYKIALRVGTKPCSYYYIETLDGLVAYALYDYHFMRQTDTGQWAEKHGYGGDSILWDVGMTPDTIPWTLNGVPYYDSDIIYYAIGKGK